MVYEVKSGILGFDNLKKVEFSQVDELFATLKSEEEGISFTILNPYLLREYSFDIPSSIKALLGINKDSHVIVYNVVVIKDPIDESLINFLAPILLNTDNNTCAQVVLKASENPTLGLAEPIKNFKKS